MDVLQDPNDGAAVLYRVSGGAVVVEAVNVSGYWRGAVRVAAAWSGAAVVRPPGSWCSAHGRHRNYAIGRGGSIFCKSPALG